MKKDPQKKDPQEKVREAVELFKKKPVISRKILKTGLVPI